MFNDSHLPPSEIDGASATPAPRFSRLALCITAASALALGVVGTVEYGVWFNHDQQAYAEAIANARQSLGTPAASRSPGEPSVAAQAETPSVADAPSRSAAGTETIAAAARSSSGRGELARSDPQRDEGGAQAVWSGPIVQAAAPATASAIAPASLAGAKLAAPAASGVPAANAAALHSGRRAGAFADPKAAQAVATRKTVKDTRPNQQERRIAAANARQVAHQNDRHPDNLFARMEQFFRHVSYAQHGGANQRQPDLYSHP